MFMIMGSSGYILGPAVGGRPFLEDPQPHCMSHGYGLSEVKIIIRIIKQYLYGNFQHGFHDWVLIFINSPKIHQTILVRSW
jgi:hypothetical protein